MKYKQGDILTNGTTTMKVLGVCGEVYLMSAWDVYQRYGTGYKQGELDEYGFKLSTEPETVEVNGKTYKLADIEKLKEVK